MEGEFPDRVMGGACRKPGPPPGDPSDVRGRGQTSGLPAVIGGTGEKET